ncbi:MAG: type IV pilus modification protein PilV [Wenzhouxiangella sp.]|nr:MAG: type IV pilus modification protein PilV [Wenzhouxiangella sp.]
MIKNTRFMGRQASRQRGVTLIEILITLLVLSVGLLGLAALQIYSVQSAQVSAQRTLALNLATKIADDWRANRAGCTGAAPVRLQDLPVTWNRLFESGNPQAVVQLRAGDATVVCGANEMLTVTITWPSGRFDEDFDPTDTERLERVVLVTRI